MRSCHVNLGERSYVIRVGRSLAPELFAEQMGEGKAFCCVDEKVAALHGERLDELFPGIERLRIPSGEASKCLAEFERLSTRLLSLGCGRDAMLFAVGGGVTGDLAGFVAACYMRGIPFVQVPTTLLAQVDASVGGKVAVNLPGVKNIIGAFHQPRAVLADLRWLRTLPRRELAAGLAEVVKMGAILDPAFLDELDALGAGLLDPELPELEAIVSRSCELKRDIVVEDETEQGRRQILNFGHTLAHAIEGEQSDASWLHGEAVAVGMLAALRLGLRLGRGKAAMIDRMEGLLAKLGLPCRLPPRSDPERLVALMSSDKKRREAGHRLVLLDDWGRAEYGVPVEAPVLLAVLKELAS